MLESRGGENKGGVAAAPAKWLRKSFRDEERPWSVPSPPYRPRCPRRRSFSPFSSSERLVSCYRPHFVPFEVFEPSVSDPKPGPTQEVRRADCRAFVLSLSRHGCHKVDTRASA